VSLILLTGLHNNPSIYYLVKDPNIHPSGYETDLNPQTKNPTNVGLLLKSFGNYSNKNSPLKIKGL